MQQFAKHEFKNKSYILKKLVALVHVTWNTL